MAYVPTESSLPASREPAVSRRDLRSAGTNHAAMSFSCLLDERSISSGGSIPAVRQSSLAVIRQHDSTALNRDSRLLVRAWRSLIELRIDDASATIGQFDNETARADALVAPRSREFAEVLRAMLRVLKSQDGAMVRAALAVLERRHRSGGKSSALAAALRIGYWKVRDFDRYYAVPRLNHAVPTHRGTHGVATTIGSTFEAVVEAEQLRLAVATRLARNARTSRESFREAITGDSPGGPRARRVALRGRALRRPGRSGHGEPHGGPNVRR